jgi:cell fate regulator YaaT (PSP1 superfamily)
MSHLIEVAFKGNRKEFFLWEADESPSLKAPVIVDADRGEDLGHVHAFGDLAEKRSAGAAHGLGDAPASKKVRRVASDDDVRRFAEVRAQDEDARRKAMERVKANDLVMKISDAEWQWDRKKLTFYFTAEKRVDFRNLVRELAAMFRTRIELKQIGVRDEAKRLDGIGRCGRQYCSSSWLPELRPVNLGVAKDQRLSLNPSQISGACGRLMCCLRYEHDFYVLQRKRFPKEGRLVRTSRGEEKVVANDIFRERVTLRGSDGEVRLLSLEELRAELGASGIPLAITAVLVEEHEPVDARVDAEEEGELITSSVDVSVDEDEAPLETTSEAEAETAPVDGESAAADAARKPHRRRGRRGGRRNRAGRDRGDSGNGSDGSSSGN